MIDEFDDTVSETRFDDRFSPDYLPVHTTPNWGAILVLCSLSGLATILLIAGIGIHAHEQKHAALSLKCKAAGGEFIEDHSGAFHCVTPLLLKP